jgi:rhodanese-related sulfurtransferase
MLHQIMQFAIRHWPLVGAFVLVVILLIMEEAKNQGPASGKLSSSAVTHLINREEGLVIDVRDGNAFRDGHIVNAKNIPLIDIDRQQEKLLNTHRDKPIILVDVSGFKTPTLMIKLKKAGFQKVFLLKGGMDTWKMDNMPITKK